MKDINVQKGDIKSPVAGNSINLLAVRTESDKGIRRVVLDKDSTTSVPVISVLP